MGLVPTVKVVKEDSDRGYMIIAEEDYDPDQHTPYSERGEEESPYSYGLASNGFWTVYEDGDEVASGRGKESLDVALAEVGETRETATEID